MLSAMNAVKVWACPGSNATGSRFPLQVRTRRSSSLAGFPLQSLTRTAAMVIVSLFIAGCAGPSADDCTGMILDLEMRSPDEPVNKILAYYESHPFVEIKDTTELLRFEEPGRIGRFFQASDVDSARRKFTYSVIEGLIKTSTYQWDLLALVDKDLESANIKYWLKSYDADRKQVGHLDFAYWSGAGFGSECN